MTDALRFTLGDQRLGGALLTGCPFFYAPEPQARPTGKDGDYVGRAATSSPFDRRSQGAGIDTPLE